MKHDFCQTIGKGHGRIEIRRCWTIDDLEQLSCLDSGKEWPGLSSIGAEQHRDGGGGAAGGRPGRETGRRWNPGTIYIQISSLDSDAARLLRATRSHWGIGNSVHWVLEVSFREDESRVRTGTLRTGNAPENLAIIRHMALNLLRQDRTSKASIKAKRKLAGWDNDCLLSILSN